MNALARLVRLAPALLAIAATGAQAGGPLSICNDTDKTPLAYSPATVNLNYDQGSLGSRSKAQADTIVTNAVALWTNVGTATITIGRGADLPVNVTTANIISYYDNFSDGLNPVIYDTDGSIIDLLFGGGQKNFVLGFAGSAYFLAPTCRFAEGQAVINGFIGVTDTTLSVVMAHEIGHLIGMDHTQLDNTQGLVSAFPSNYPLMYPIAFRDIVSLHEDDIAAVSALYPDATLNSVYGQISGTFVLADGVTPVRGANLWATETTTNKVFSIVSDYRTQNTGDFKLLLPAGTYQLRAEAIESQFDGGSSVGPYSEQYPGRDGIDYSFLSPLYAGGAAMSTLTLGNATPTAFVITAGCAATLTFRFDGTGTVGGNCAPSAPGAPTNVMITPGPGSATVSFTAPSSGSPITSYTVTCTASGQVTVTATGTSSPITVEGLIGDVAYSCSVAATNSAGTGAASAAAQVTPSVNTGIVPLLMLLLE